VVIGQVEVILLINHYLDIIREDEWKYDEPDATSNFEKLMTLRFWLGKC
jgi:hypothetical protein